MRTLRQTRAEINARTNDGYTAFSYALTNEDDDMIKLLRSKGGVGEPLPTPKEDPEGDDEP